MEGVIELERRLTGEGSAGHLSDIAKLYGHCESSDLKVVAEALRAISRVLAHHRCRLAAESGLAEGASAANKALVGWLAQHGDTYFATLAKLATSANPHAQVCAIRLAMEAIRNEDTEARNSSAEAKLALPRVYPERRLQSLVQELLVAPHWSEHACECLTGEFVRTYGDVRHTVLQHLRDCCRELGQAKVVDAGGTFQGPEAKRRKKNPHAPARGVVEQIREQGLAPQEIFSRVFAVLREAPAPSKKARQHQQDASTLANATAVKAKEEEGEEVPTLAPGTRPAGFYVRKYGYTFQDAWVQLLSLPVPLKQCSQVLQFLPEHVLPHLLQPLILADFYLRAFHSGSTEVAVLSLSGLLLLLTQYGLGDPETLSSSCNEFYGQLYSLFKPETFRLRKRARFQRLAVAALSSGLLPARFAAVFAKKCMVTAVSCNEPGTVMWLMSVSYGLIQKHHSHCQYLLHRPPAEGEAPEKFDKDPFDSAAPFTTVLEQAPRTSLWELQVLQRHHLPAVSTLAKLFLKPFFRPSSRKLDPELFLDQSVENSYQQALRAGQRQLAKWQARSERCPMAFKLEDNEKADRVVRLAALLSTSQRKLGAEG